MLEILDAPIDVVEARRRQGDSDARGELAFEAVTLGTDRQSRVLETCRSPRARADVALVGGSGVGKSTIAYLATRLLDPDTGVVRLDGTGSARR